MQQMIEEEVGEMAFGGDVPKPAAGLVDLEAMFFIGQLSPTGQLRSSQRRRFFLDGRIRTISRPLAGSRDGA